MGLSIAALDGNQRRGRGVYKVGVSRDTDAVSIHDETRWFHRHIQLQRRIAPPVMPPSITSSAPVM